MQILSSSSPISGNSDKVRRELYLRSKGINPSGPVQLDLIFPGLKGSNLRFIPNDYARSSLFTVRNKREPRRTIQQESLFHLHDTIHVIFTGIELRAEDDELVWLQILHYSKGVPFGEPFEFSIRQLCKDLGWHLNGTYYNKVRQCISRLKASEVMIISQKSFGNGGAVSLIDSYLFTNNADCRATRYKTWIHRDLILLFAGSTYTNHHWPIYRELSPVARRLADYIRSHKHPFPLRIERFRQVCGSSDTQLKSWRETVKKACAEVVKGNIATCVWLERDLIYIST